MHHMATPQPKSNELIDQLNTYLLKGVPVDEFTLRRWRRDADAMIQNPDTRSKGYMALGMLASTLHDYVGLHDNFKLALHYDDADGSVFANYLISLENVFLLQEAYDLVKECKDSNGDEVGINYWLAREAFSSGRFIEGACALKLLSEDAIMELSEFVDVESSAILAQWMEQFLIEDDVMASLFSSIYGLMSERKLPPVHTMLTYLGDDGFLFKWFVRLSVDETVDLNIELSERLASSDLDILIDSISFMFVPMDDE